MPGISDFFSPESVGTLMRDPRLMLGLQLLAQGRQGSSSQAIGQAGSQAVQMYGQQKHQQGLADYRNNLARMQQEQLQMQQAKAQQQADQQRQYQARLQDPAFLQSLSPMARQMAQLGVDPSELIRAQSADALQQHRQAQLGQQQSQFDTRQAHQGGGQSSGPRAPAPRAFVDQPLGGDMYQRYQFDAQSGGYQPWGEPFNKHSTRKPKAATGADAMTNAILNGTAPSDEEPVPDASSLPGTAPLSAYAPRTQGPVGVMPMSAAGGNAAQRPAPKAGTRVPGQPKIAEPMTQEDYAALPSGTQYRDPVSGKVATKR